jgi:phosphoribosyl-AMP cyclohydrolase / phosphoribosyl-ATP pyrophosphohydrolase
VTERLEKMAEFQVASLDWQKMGGMVPAIIQDVATSQILMLGYMTQESLVETLNRGRVVFFSRSKDRLWEKGETSGHFLELREITMDCDGDALLIKVSAKGPCCHKGTVSCFAAQSTTHSILGELDKMLAAKQAREVDESSYSSKLLHGSLHRVAQKVGEEGVEVALAAKDGKEKVGEFLGEAADLMFHLIVLVRAKGKGLTDVLEELQRRQKA